MDLRGIYTIFQLNIKEYIVYSAAYGSFFKIDHMLEYKIHLNKYRKKNNSMYPKFDHHAIKLKIRSH